MKSLDELRQVEHFNRAGEFTRFVKHLAQAGGNFDHAASLAKGSRAPERVVTTLQQKAAVSAGGLSEWGSELLDYRLMANAFTDALRHSSIFYRMLGDSAIVRLPFNVLIGAIGTAAGASIVAPGQAIPVRRMSLTTATLDELKAAALVALSRELLNAGGAAVESLISRSLRASVSEAVDAQFVAIIMSGVSPSASTAAALVDLRILLDAVDPTEESRLYFLAAPGVAIRAATLATNDLARVFPEASPVGGQLLGIPMLVSSAVTSGRLILCDAARLAGASGEIEVDVSRAAALQMNDLPTMTAGELGSPSAPVGTVATSMFQTNSVAVRCIATFGAAVVRAGGVAAIDIVAWGEGSP